MKPWIVCQIGAREHYAIPRAVQRAGGSVFLITDFWHRNYSTSFSRRLRQRRHPEIDDKWVRSFNAQTVRFETLAWLRQLRGVHRDIAHGKWFSQLAASRLPSLVGKFSERPTVFSYSYAAASIFRTAKQLGCRTILGQSDPGPEEARIVSELHRRYGYPHPSPPNPAYWENWKAECELADSILVNSEWSRSALLRIGIDPSKIAIAELAYESPKVRQIPSKVYPSEFTKERPLRILYLGQIVLRKGVLEITEAIRSLHSLPIEWSFVGGGDESLINRIRSLPATRFVGSVSRLDVDRYYQEADVFILPTHSDGYAITQLEAAYNGLPIIASQCCGKVVENGLNGWVLPEVSAPAIATAVRQCLEHPGMLKTMHEYQLQHKPRDIDELSQKLLELFDESASSPLARHLPPASAPQLDTVGLSIGRCVSK